MVRQFAGLRTLEEIRTRVEAAGYRLDTKRFDQGSDYILIDAGGRRISVSLWNGCFSVYVQGCRIADERSVNLDGVGWYDEILDLIYLPLAAGVGPA